MSGKDLVAKLEQAYAAQWSATVDKQLQQMGIDGEELARSARRHMVDIRPSTSSSPRQRTAPAAKSDAHSR